MEQKQRKIENTHPRYACFEGKFFSVTFDKTTGGIAFFGVESGGRDRDKHASYNLMLPSYGAKNGAFKKHSPIKSEFTDNTAFFENSEGSVAFYEIKDLHTLNIKLNKALSNDIFSTRLAIKTAPPTIWTRNEPKKLKSRNPMTIFKSRYELPMIVFFPDYGRVEISSSDKDVFCEEELQLSKEFTGLDLGCKNYSYNHNRIHSLHYGSSFLTFKSKSPLESVELTFKVLDECYPSFPEENDERYNGLKRNWLNSFALNRELFDMGDNIYFHGTGHLAVHMKSDLLQIMDDGNEQFEMIRRAFERQMKRSFLHSQAYDGEVSVCYFNKEKKGGFACSVDSTPGAIIALTGIASWNLPLAKKLLPNAVKAADYLLTRDTDGDGIFESPFPGDYMGQPTEFGQQGNWWDNMAFGHKDIYFNYLCHRALRELSELLHKLDKHSLAEKYEKQLEKFDAVFFDTFYNPDTDLMAGWISRNGAIHDYGFTFAVSMGINEGLIPRDTGRRMIKTLLRIMDKEGYGELRFGIPGNVMPIAPADTIDWACMSDWGQYENGGLCGMNGFHFLTSMYNVGLTKEADKILFAILNTYEKELTHSGLMPGYCKSIDWRTKNGVPCGYNYLADNYYFLLSVYAGKFNFPHSAVIPCK
ncbi:MAG: hypothetical protein IJW19_05685 [Clostridia bacterium]|nr:hypothetical protein [Clostridia bacterium]